MPLYLKLSYRNTFLCLFNTPAYVLASNTAPVFGSITFAFKTLFTKSCAPTSVLKPLPPDVNYIKKVGVLKNSNISLELIQESDYFGVIDAVDGVISLAWEKSDSDDLVISKYKRLVFLYGETVDEVENKLYERDIVLKWEKNLVTDETHES